MDETEVERLRRFVTKDIKDLVFFDWFVIPVICCCLVFIIVLESNIHEDCCGRVIVAVVTSITFATRCLIREVATLNRQVLHEALSRDARQVLVG
jgi:hypothetical protein